MQSDGMGVLNSQSKLNEETIQLKTSVWDTIEKFVAIKNKPFKGRKVCTAMTNGSSKLQF